MHAIRALIESSLPAAWIALAAAFIVLAKCADLFVDSAVAIARRLRIPKLVIGIVLVSLATTAPELSVSLMAALRGSPEVAMGNAIGSVICNAGLALALCALVAAAPIPVIPHVLRSSGSFLAGIAVLCFLFTGFDCTLRRWEGAVLLLCFCGYVGYLLRQHQAGVFAQHAEEEHAGGGRHMGVGRVLLSFAISLGGIVAASDFIVTSASTIARAFGVPDAVVALTMVALGTSIPEIATCISAARKGEGALAVGNILGADIMNICWVAGASAIANDLTLTRREVWFMFPAMFILVGTMLAVLRAHYRLSRRQGVLLLALYAAYLASFALVFRPGQH